MDITLTDNAYEHLRDLRKKHNKEFIRLDVKAGGCAGYEYEWSFDDKETRDDRIVDDILLVHKMYEIYLAGTEIDYDKDDFGATFKFSNPAAKSSCGCGTSFSV
jgi:iron-sulfur cluster insertion protein